MTAGERAGGWRLAPGTLRLHDGRLAGGTPFRVVTLGAAGRRVLRDVLAGTPRDPEAPAALALTRRLVRQGLLVGPDPRSPFADDPLDDVTVVVPARTTGPAAQACVAQLPAGVPVVVVDDGSAAPLSGSLAPRGQLTMIRHPRARGPAAARNAGAARVSTRLIAFLDADVSVTPDALRQLAACVAPADEAARLAGDAVVAAAPRILSPPAGRGAAARLEWLAGGLDLGPESAEVTPGGRVSYLPSALLMVDARAFRAVGGFDERLSVAEDVDLIWRMRTRGRVVYRAGIRAGHAPRASVAEVLRRRFAYGTGAAPLELRSPGTIRHAGAARPAALAWLTLLGGSPALAAGISAGGLLAAPGALPMLGGRDALRLSTRAHLASWPSLSRYLLRPLWPVTALAAAAMPSLRGPLAYAAVAGYAPDALRLWGGDDARALAARAPALVLEAVAARALTDLAYATGVWAGCLRHRTLGPLLPRLHR